MQRYVNKRNADYTSICLVEARQYEKFKLKTKTTNTHKLEKIFFT